MASLADLDCRFLLISCKNPEADVRFHEKRDGIWDTRLQFVFNSRAPEEGQVSLLGVEELVQRGVSVRVAGYFKLLKCVHNFKELLLAQWPLCHHQGPETFSCELVQLFLCRGLFDTTRELASRYHYTVRPLAHQYVPRLLRQSMSLLLD